MIRKYSPLLFVYGTLRRGFFHPMARRLSLEARYVGTARMAGRLYRVASYPGAILNDSGNWVVGDVFELPNANNLLKWLDRYEGCARGQSLNPLFIRQSVEVALAAPRTLTAWVYLYNRSVAALPEIPGGDYLALPGLARAFQADKTE